MADAKISALTSASTPLAGTEVLPIVQSGSTKKVTVANLTAGRSIAAADVVASGELTTTTNNARISMYRTTGTNYFDWASGQTLAFGTQTSQGGGGRVNKVNFTDAGNVEIASGNLVISTAGKGIDFSADAHATGMTSELFDDYEEGTWTPVIGGETSQSGQAYTAQRGMYTKVGRMVTCTFDVVLATKGTITGDVALKGLPFTALNDANARYPACNIGLWQNLASGYVYINGVVIDNSTYAGLRGITAAATALAGFGTAAITDTTRFSGTVTYFTA